MTVILVGNYEPDAQESMQRFARMLREHLVQRKIAVLWLKPKALLGRWVWGGATVRKWLGYCDKLLFFPYSLRRQIRRARAESSGQIVVHICDQGNAHYVRGLAHERTLVTCHDVLAIRSALGDIAENPTGRLGRSLQRRIVEGLNRADRVACVSDETRSQLLNVARLHPDRVSVIHNGLNAPYEPMGGALADRLLEDVFAGRGGARAVALARGRASWAKGRRYILHVGGNQWYKNRMGLLRIYAGLAQSCGDVLDLVLAGKPLSDEMRHWMREHPHEGTIRLVEAPSNETLRALYSRADLFVFPSLAEGFGWPVVEAQACGCLVIASARAPLTEIGGEAVWYCDPADEKSFIRAVREVVALPPQERERRRSQGLEHSRRFQPQAMIQAYVDLYGAMLSRTELP